MNMLKLFSHASNVALGTAMIVSQLFSPILKSKLKYLEKYHMDGTTGSQKIKPNNCWHPEVHILREMSQHL